MHVGALILEPRPVLTEEKSVASGFQANINGYRPIFSPK